jgi:hypothetical protein
MNDNEPRPMPPEVLRAYRDPLDLAKLLATDVFTDESRLEVRDELLRRLITKYGSAEIEFGPRLLTVTQGVAKFRNNPWKGIDLLRSVPEYGDDVVMDELAHIMQPYWAKWWEWFRWSDWASLRRWRNIAIIVLGNRQFRWLAAQYARSVVDLAGEQNRRACVDAIEIVEAYALDPSDKNKAKMEVARAVADAARAAVAADAGSAAMADGSSAVNAVRAATRTGIPDAAYSLYDAAYYAAKASGDSQYKQFVAITRRLITPTLITSASRGLR